MDDRTAVTWAPVTRRAFLGAVPLIAVGVTAGCGYALAGRGSFLPDYIQRVGIPMFLNRTPFVNVELQFTEQVRIEFQNRGRYTIVTTDEGVDGIVRGEVMSISLSPVSFTEGQLATRYRFTVTVSVQFYDARQRRVLWENPALSFSDEYELASGTSFGLEASAFLDQERAAIERLSNDFARSVVSAILEAF